MTRPRDLHRRALCHLVVDRRLQVWVEQADLDTGKTVVHPLREAVAFMDDEGRLLLHRALERANQQLLPPPWFQATLPTFLGVYGTPLLTIFYQGKLYRYVAEAAPEKVRARGTGPGVSRLPRGASKRGASTAGRKHTGGGR